MYPYLMGKPRIQPIGTNGWLLMLASKEIYPRSPRRSARNEAGDEAESVRVAIGAHREGMPIARFVAGLYCTSTGTSPVRAAT